MSAPVAATLPTVGGTALDIVDHLDSIKGKTVPIVEAAGGVGSFLTQLVAQGGARLLTIAPAGEAERMHAAGPPCTSTAPAASPYRKSAQPAPPASTSCSTLASDTGTFAVLAELVHPGGTAMTTRYVADTTALSNAGVTGIDFQVTMTPELLVRLSSIIVAGHLATPRSPR
jgi:NADPH:quinone reductase-like Zn-dependent oxidoreductase